VVAIRFVVFAAADFAVAVVRFVGDTSVWNNWMP